MSLEHDLGVTPCVKAELGIHTELVQREPLRSPGSSAFPLHDHVEAGVTDSPMLVRASKVSKLVSNPELDQVGDQVKQRVCLTQRSEVSHDMGVLPFSLVLVMDLDGGEFPASLPRG